MVFGQLRASISVVRSSSYTGSDSRVLTDPTGERRNPRFRQRFHGLRPRTPRTLEALRPAPSKPRFPACLLIRIEPLKGIIGEALLVLHAVARHRLYPENLRDFRKIIPQHPAECRWYSGFSLTEEYAALSAEALISQAKTPLKSTRRASP